MAVTVTRTYDHPDRPPARDERTKIVFENFHRSRTEFMDKRQRDKFKALYKAYRAFFDTADEGSTSNLSVPLIKAHVNSFYARIVGMRPIVDIQPREPGDVTKALKQRRMIEYQWDRMQMLLHSAMLAKSALIYGIGWAKCTWRREVRSRLVRRRLELPMMVSGIDLGPFQGLLEGLEAETFSDLEDVAVWDDPFFEVVPPDQVYPAIDATCEDSARYLIHRTPMAFDELEAMIKGGQIEVNNAAVGRLKKALREGSLLTDEVDTTLQEEIADTFGGTGDSGTSEDPTRREFMLLEHWTDERVRWAVSGNPELGLIRDEPHALGMKPFIRFTPDPLPNELIGGALTEDLFSINLEMNALKNARMDNVFRQVHPQIMIPFGVPYNPSHLRFKAGGRFLYDPQNPPAFFEYPQAGSLVSYREMADLRQMAEEIGGTRTFRGLEGEGDTTATEASLLAQASGTRFGAMLQQMNEQPFKRLGRLLVRLNELNVTEDRWVRVLGQEAAGLAGEEQFEQVTPGDLAGSSLLDVTIDIAQKDPDTRLVKLRRAVEAVSALYQAVQADPALYPLARQAAVEMARLHDIPGAEALLKQGEMMVQQQQMMMQQQQAMQGGVGNFQGQQRTGSEGSQMAADVNNATGLPS